MSVNLKNISVAAKTYLICAVFMGSMICIGATSWVLLNSIEKEMVEIAEEEMPLIRALTEVTVNSLEQAVLLEKIVPMYNDAEATRQFHEDFDRRVAENQKAFDHALELTGAAKKLAASPESLAALGKSVASSMG